MKRCKKGDCEWTAVLFYLSNKLVSIFGLKVPDKKSNRQESFNNFKSEPSERLGLFRVYDKTQDEVILGEDDQHLNFRISLLKGSSNERTGLKKLTISTTGLESFISSLQSLFTSLLCQLCYRES